MRLDPATLTIVTVFVTALVGALLLFSWWRSRDCRALAWWAASCGVAAAAVLLLIGRGALPRWLSIGVGNAVLLLGFGLFWGGFRVFERRRAPWIAVAAGAILWLAACGVPVVYKHFDLRVLLASIVSALYACLAAGEVWRGRRDGLRSRDSIVVVLVAHAAFLLSRYPTLHLWGEVEEHTVFSLAWAASHAFETLIFTVTIAFLLLTMSKERVEAEQRSIAARDPLTGVLNRRSFVEDARRALDRARRAGRPCALLITDLDHFKRVNDRFGHAAGDEVLRGFCATATRVMPEGALLARLGGEEFACLLDGGAGSASELAGRLRRDFAARRFETDHEVFTATVSIGIGLSDDVGHILEALLAAADVALYEAKAEGRNTVCVASLAAEPAGHEVRTPRLVPLAA